MPDMLLRRISVASFSLLFLSMVGGVWAVEYGGIGGRPANPRPDNPRTESIFIYTGEPGAVFLDGIKVINNSKERKSLRVYAVDEEVSSGGAFSCEQYSQDKDNVGSWIDLQSEIATLSAVSSQTVPFVVTIPNNAGVGEHNGCIVVQPEDPPISNENGGIQLRMRTALRVLITVPGEIRRKLEILSSQLEHRQEQNDMMVRAEIQNIGNASADAKVKTSVSSFLPFTVFNSEGEYPILRNSTYSLNLQAPYPFWGGWYRVNVSARYAPTAMEAVGVELNDNEYETVESHSDWYWFTPDPRALAVYAGFGDISTGYLCDGGRAKANNQENLAALSCTTRRVIG